MTLTGLDLAPDPAGAGALHAPSRGLDAVVIVAPRRGPLRRWIFATFAGLYLLTASGRMQDNSDMILMYGMAHGLAYEGTLGVPQDIVGLLPPVPNNYNHLRGRGGAVYSPKGVAYSLLMVPLVLAGRAVHSLAGDAKTWFPETTMLAASMATPLLAALNAALVFETLAVLGFALRTAGVVTLAAGLGTILWAGSADHSLESVTGVLITATFLGLARLARSPRPLWGVWIGGALGLLALAQPVMLATAVPVAALYALVVLLRARGWLGAVPIVLAGAAAMSVGLGLLAWSNLVRYDKLLVTGYEWAANSTMVPLWVGVYGFFFSAGKSIFLYSPPLLLAAAAVPCFLRRVGWPGSFPLALLAAFVFVYGRLAFWNGDGAWGPRYLVPLTGCLCTMLAGFLVSSSPAERRWRRAALTLSVVLGVVVNLIGTTTSTADYFRLLLKHRLVQGYPGSARWSPVLYDPELSPIAGRAHVMASAVHRTRTGQSLTWTAPMRNGRWRPITLSGFDGWQPWVLRLHAGPVPTHGVLGWWPGTVRYTVAFAVLLAAVSALGVLRLWQLGRALPAE
jgi:hypothetical protein